MSTIYKSDTADYSANPRGFIANAPSLPSGVFFPAVSALAGSKNFATLTAAAADIVGAPGVNAAYLSFDGLVAFLQSQVDETGAMTWILAGRNTDTMAATATQPQLIGNFDSGGTPQGAGFYIVSTGPRLTFTVDNAGANAQQTVSMVQASAISNVWNMYALVIRPGVEGAIYNLRTAQTQITPETRARIIAPRKIRIGSGWGGPAGNSDIAFAAMLPVALTLAQCQALAAPVQLFLNEKRGIVA